MQHHLFTSITKTSLPLIKSNPPPPHHHRHHHQNLATKTASRTKMSPKTTTTTATATTTSSRRNMKQLTQGSLLIVYITSLLLLIANLNQGSQAQYLQESSPQETSVSNSNAVQSVLLDTTQHSSLAWTRYPDGPQNAARTPGWAEESFFNFERGINWRSFVVCDVAFDSVNNWLWVPFIQRNDANRLYIEIKFTMRDCNLFPQRVLSCKETFALLYKEMDSPILSSSSSSSSSSNSNNHHLLSLSNASFAQTDSFTLIDAIAADDGRFTSNTDVVINTEIRSIPVSKRGVYFAFRDQGACLSLISIKVYHLSCPQLTTNFARFNSTPTGRDLTSLVAVEGQCVENSIQIEQPKMFCTADGNWNQMASGQCKCLAGFEPQANNTKCSPCLPGRFKHLMGDSSCQACPDRSYSLQAGSSECKCHEGYYRSQKDSRLNACTQPPSAPDNLTAIYVDSTSVILQWQQPKFSGGRDDISYKLICESCDSTLISSPIYLMNFSETKCVLSNLIPNSQYKFLLYSMNGVSNIAAARDQHQAKVSEIIIQTKKSQEFSASNQLSSTSGLQPMPIFNFRALQGARGNDIVLAWDSQTLSEQLNVVDSMSASSPTDTPALYEIKYQPRAEPIGRRSPYPINLVDNQTPNWILGANNHQQMHQFVTTTNKALLVNNLQPRTEYCFQIRFKWSTGSQWSDFSEPIYKTTGAPSLTAQQLPPSNELPASFPGDILGNSIGSLNNQLFNLPTPPTPTLYQQRQDSAGALSWLGSVAFGFFVILVIFALVSLSLIQLRKAPFLGGMQSLGVAGFGSFGNGSGGGSTYGPVYAHAPGNPFAAGPGNPLAAGGHPLYHNTHAHQHHHATLSAGSAGGLITGSNGTSRSNSNSSGGGGSGNVVQNFIAATLQQIHRSKQPVVNGINQHQAINNFTMGGLHHGAHSQLNGKHLFSAANNGTTTNTNTFNTQRNLYQQTLQPMAGSNGFQQQQQQQHHLMSSGQQLADLQQPSEMLFKYRQEMPGAQHFNHHHNQEMQSDPQMHIYDDLDNTTASQMEQTQQTRPAHSEALELDPQTIAIESVIGRGEFGDVCLATLTTTNPNNGQQSTRRVAVKTLKPQASEKAKLDFLVEASIMSQFQHPNVIQLLGVVTRSEPAMIVTDIMENGSLDAYLRANKNRISCEQLISMLRGIASGMQYLASLNYVHKDLAARNILVSEDNVCKIADFGLSAHQSLSPQANPSSPQNGLATATTDSGTYTNSAATDSSTSSAAGSIGSQATGSTPSTLAVGGNVGGASPKLSQLQGMAEQMAQQRFSLSQQVMSQPAQQANLPFASAIQNPKVPVRWTALEAIAFRRFTSASDVWSFGIVAWEVMSYGERPYWNWNNQDVIKALEQGYRLPKPENCPEQLYKLMLDCWLKERAARPTFQQIVTILNRLLNPYDDPFVLQQQQPSHTRISSQEPAYYESYNPIGHLINNNKSALNLNQQQHSPNPNTIHPELTVDEWLNSIKMSRYKENFQKHQVNSLQYVARLSQADLSLIGVNNGQHLKKFQAAIGSLRSASSIGASGEGYLV